METRKAFAILLLIFGIIFIIGKDIYYEKQIKNNISCKKEVKK